MKLKAIVAPIALLVTIILLGWNYQTKQDSKPEFFSKNNMAIAGYDVVAFFTEGKPVLGNEQISLKYKGANWFFANNDNLAKFKANPERYLPQYGGYCAFGMSKGYKAPVEVDTWTIDNGKLYFNYNMKVKQSWVKNQQEFIQKADENWKNFKH